MGVYRRSFDYRPAHTSVATLFPASAGSVSGTIAATDAADTSIITGTESIAGALAPTDAADSSAITGSESISGVLASTDAADTSVITGGDTVQVNFTDVGLSSHVSGNGTNSLVQANLLECSVNGYEAYYGFTESVSYTREIYLSQEMKFASDYDFGQGQKILRLRAFNVGGGVNYWDFIAQITSQGSTSQQAGTNDSYQITISRNGGSTWGSYTVSLQRSRWYNFTYRFYLNSAQGVADGIFQMWLDNTQIFNITSLDLVGAATWNNTINRVLWGGWYSNGAGGNPNSAPEPMPAKYQIRNAYRSSSAIAYSTPVQDTYVPLRLPPAQRFAQVAYRAPAFPYPRMRPVVDILDVYQAEAPIGQGDIQSLVQSLYRKPAPLLQSRLFPAALFATSTSVSGVIAATDAADTSTVTGSESVSGAIAATDAADTCSISDDGTITGSLAVTDAADTAVLAAIESLIASLNPTDASDTSAVAGSLSIQGAVSLTDASDASVLLAIETLIASIASTDEADTLVTTPGRPENVNLSTPITIGLALETPI